MSNSEDYFDDLAEVAIASRLKRLSDSMLSDASQVYKLTGQSVEAKWFTLISLIADKKQVSVVQAANFLGLSQPCISQFSREMYKQGLIKFEIDAGDLRKKIMLLSNKGKSTFVSMSKLRNAFRTAAQDLCQEVEHNFYQCLKQFEKALAKKSLLKRTLENYNEEQQTS